MADLLQLAGISLDAAASSREGAVAICGNLLVSLGAVSQPYADAMWEREQAFSSALGDGVAIPHGTDESRQYVTFDQLVIVRFSPPVTWVDEDVTLCVGIASRGDGHVELLGNLADILLDADSAATLTTSTDPEAIKNLVMKGI